MYYSKSMLNNLIDRIKLLFRPEKELYSSLYKIIGFYPRDINLYRLALMHKSVMRRNDKGKPENNERLEFLGDAILDAIVGHIVYDHFPGKREGFLTNTRSKLVQRETLNKLAQEMGINNLILCSGRSSSHNNYMGGNAFEALIGAMYLDRGYNACMHFMQDKILSEVLNIDKVAFKEVNFKSKLIEWSQKNKIKLEFKLLEQKKDESGNPKFKYMVELEEIEGCSGEGFSKKESQQQACKFTLEQLKHQSKFVDSIFTAKANRTKMEEELETVVPEVHDISETEVSELSDPIIEVSDAALDEVIHSDEVEGVQSAEQLDEEATSESDDNNEFDLEEISLKPQSIEEIIAKAEQAAYAEK